MLHGRWFSLPLIGGTLLWLAAPWRSRPRRPNGSRCATRHSLARSSCGDSRTEIDEVGERYAVAAELETRGVTGFLLDLAEHSNVKGRLTADSAVPEAFRSDVRRNGEDRHDRGRLPR